jgi:hypothetical protein
MPSLSATRPALCRRESGSAMTRRSLQEQKTAERAGVCQPMTSVSAGASRSHAPPKPASSSGFGRIPPKEGAPTGRIGQGPMLFLLQIQAGKRHGPFQPNRL